jgi:hypothetical protein
MREVTLHRHHMKDRFKMDIGYYNTAINSEVTRFERGVMKEREIYRR